MTEEMINRSHACTCMYRQWFVITACLLSPSNFPPFLFPNPINRPFEPHFSRAYFSLRPSFATESQQSQLHPYETRRVRARWDFRDFAARGRDRLIAGSIVESYNEQTGQHGAAS